MFKHPWIPEKKWRKLLKAREVSNKLAVHHRKMLRKYFPSGNQK